MRKRNEPENECAAELGSVTTAMHAQGLLREVSIDSRVIKTDGGANGGGCSYAVTFPCDEQYRLQQVLALAGIPVRRIISSGFRGKKR